MKDYKIMVASMGYVELINNRKFLTRDEYIEKDLVEKNLI